ncbi:MAG: histidine phosphatase family protein [Ketobacteraceae bacterium]|nr:histidine phosphatase family protein [Ketobacteraceae bacterium]
MASIYLIRHGQASFGQANYDALSELGKRQSRVMGEGMAKRQVRFDRIIHGGLVRHQETAEHCIEGIDYPSAPAMEIDERFSEYNHQEVIARHKPELACHQSMAEYLAQQSSPRKAFQALFAEAIGRWVSGDFDHEYGESWQSFQRRCGAGLNDLIHDSDHRHIAIFTSGGPISIILQHLLNLNNEQAVEMSWSIVNASVTRLLFKSGRVSLSYLNDYGYLEQTNPDLVTYR